jgi:hypothetical protein
MELDAAYTLLWIVVSISRALVWKMLNPAIAGWELQVA